MNDYVLMCTVFGVFILFSFIKGVEIGLRVRNNEPVTTSQNLFINPIESLKKHKSQKKYEEIKEKEQIENEINLYNIDAYDGSSLGQKNFE